MTTQSPTQRAHCECPCHRIHGMGSCTLCCRTDPQTGAPKAVASPSIEEALAALAEVTTLDARSSRATSTIRAFVLALSQQDQRVPLLNQALEDLTLLCQLVGIKLTQSGLGEYQSAKQRLTEYLLATSGLRSALTSAAQEQKTLDELFDFSPHVGITAHVGHVKTWTVGVDGAVERRYFNAPTRLAALVAAGEYCRAEMEKR